MQASLVVLSALVAVASAQFGIFGLSLNPYTGTPYDTPEVTIAKLHHLQEHNRLRFRDSMLLYRKRRDAPAPEAAAAPENNQAPAEEHKLEKRQFFALNPYFRSMPFTTLDSAWGWNPYYSSSLLYRKRRDTSDVEQPEAKEGQSKEKRQVISYTADPWLGAWSSPYPLASPYSVWGAPRFGVYPHSRIYLRKRRDTDSQAPDNKEATAAETETEPQRQKRYYPYSINPYTINPYTITPYTAYPYSMPYWAKLGYY